jgi:hypothetical protein
LGLTFLFWYCLIGFTVGMFVCCAIVEMNGWDDLLQEFNNSADVESDKVSLEVFKVIFPLGMLVVGLLVWPVFVLSIIWRKM